MGCANGLCWVCTHSSNTDDENMNVLQLVMSLVSVYETGFVLRSLIPFIQIFVSLPNFFPIITNHTSMESLCIKLSDVCI